MRGSYLFSHLSTPEIPFSKMRVLKFCELVLLVILLCDTIIVSRTDPIINREAVERKFLSQRKRLRVARKLNPIGGKMSKHYVEADPVCGRNPWDIVELCVRVAEKFFDNRTLCFGLPGKYKKSVMRPTPQACQKGRVLLQAYPKSAVRVNMFKCPTSNYIFEQGFELKDFYITSSSSRKKVYMLRDLYDTSPLHVGEYKEEMVWDMSGHLVPKRQGYRTYYDLLANATRQEDSSSSEMDDTDEPLNPIENIASNQNMSATDDGVYVANDGRVIGRLFALVDGLSLRRVYVHREPLKKDPNKVGFWRRLWNNLVEKFPRIGKNESDKKVDTL